MRHLLLLFVYFTVFAASAQNAQQGDTARGKPNEFDINVPITSDTGPALLQSPAAMGSRLSGGTSGTVTVALRIHPDGSAIDIQVLEGINDTTDQMVKDLLATSTFTPEVQNGRATSCLVVFSIPVQ